MKHVALLLWIALAVFSSPLQAAEPAFVDIPRDQLEDKIRGGMLGQLLGNLNGLPHEMKYVDEPGQVTNYRPGLPEGAFTDDDTDIEWVYVKAIQDSGQPLLEPAAIVKLWKDNLNEGIWCANRYARGLMDLGIEPPLTGIQSINPWAEFNISGQFLCESFGLMAPALPQTASRIGAYYTHVAIDGEPTQTTQLFSTMIALAFVEKDINRLIDAGLAATAPQSRVADIVRQTREICKQHPDDWRAARAEFKRRWQKHGGEMRDRNGYELNTACTIAALLYGGGDFVRTLEIAFNLGWDCDNNAATAATILGIIQGRRQLDSYGWTIKDEYRNTVRPAMPKDETITKFENRLISCAEITLKQRGAKLMDQGGRQVWRIPRETPAMLEPLFSPERRVATFREELVRRIHTDLRSQDKLAHARAVYLSLCLDNAEAMKADHAEPWRSGVEELNRHTRFVQSLYGAPPSAAQPLQERARKAGIVVGASEK